MSASSQCCQHRSNEVYILQTGGVDRMEMFKSLATERCGVEDKVDASRPFSLGLLDEDLQKLVVNFLRW